MKRAIILLAIVAIVVTACPPYWDEPTYMPIYMSRKDLDVSVEYVSGAQEMLQTGKIYYRAPYIFVNERYRGVHVINNTDPYKPVIEGFIRAPGCIDMAVKGHIMYLDNAVDLVSFDLNSRKVTSRIRNVLPEPLPPEDLFRQKPDIRPEGHIIVNWVKIEKTEEE